MNKDFFEHKAGIYEQDDNRVANVRNIGSAILGKINLDQNMHLLDFGSGTGLLLEQIAPFVQKITAVDVSKSMNEQLAQKRSRLECELEILEVDLESENISRQYDGIVSSMTMHHIADTDAIFRKFYAMLNGGGVLAIADLDSEDGSFHTEDTGVHHYGFARDSIAQTAKRAGFKDIAVSDASVVEKPHGAYPVFLLTARKQNNRA